MKKTKYVPSVIGVGAQEENHDQKRKNESLKKRACVKSWQTPARTPHLYIIILVQVLFERKGVYKNDTVFEIHGRISAIHSTNIQRSVQKSKRVLQVDVDAL